MEHCATRWESGKSMLVCIDKLTCGRMYQRIIRAGRRKLAKVKAFLLAKTVELVASETGQRDAAAKTLAWLKARPGGWRKRSSKSSSAKGKTRLLISRNGSRHHPAPGADETGFRNAGRKARRCGVGVQDPEASVPRGHRLRDVAHGIRRGCLSTLYVDKPMKAHTLMQAIARPIACIPARISVSSWTTTGCSEPARGAGSIRSRRGRRGEEEIVAPIEERVKALLSAIAETEGNNCADWASSRTG